MKPITAFLSFLAIAVASFAQPHIVQEGLPGVPGGMVEFNGSLFFALYANPYYSDADLWKSDGTATGTMLVKDFNTTSGLGEFVELHGDLFFRRTHELWKTDGTGAGTVLLKSFDSNLYVWYLTAGGDEVYFETINETGDKNELWKSDGTVFGTVMVVDILPLIVRESPNEVPEFTYANGFLFFWSTTADHGSELWRSDGTAGGTVMVKDIYPGSQPSYYDFSESDLTSMGNKVFFAADNGANGIDLWMSDGTESGTVLVKDIAPGIESSYPSFMAVAGNTLFFNATDGINGEELWKTDGTPQGTVLVKDILPPDAPYFGGATGSYPARLTEANGELYFYGSENIHGSEPWKSDGTPAGTFMVADIFPGYANSSPNEFTGINGMVFFVAQAPTTSGLWATDGTADGTNSLGETGSNIQNLTPVGNHLFFNATDALHGRTLWVYEVPNEETSRFKLINALTDTDIGTIEDGDIINLAALPTNKLNIRFETDMVSGSITFERNGRPVRTENSAPYAMAGDEPAGNYSIWTPALGAYEVCATPHSGYGGKGIHGETQCVHFTVVRSSSSKMSEIEEMETALYAGELQLYPNPNQGVFEIAYSTETITDLRVEVFDMFGKSVFREELLSFSGAYQRHLDLNAYPQGVYLLKVANGEATSVRTVVISE